jgi:hypothetical protein
MIPEERRETFGAQYSEGVGKLLLQPLGPQIIMQESVFVE